MLLRRFPGDAPMLIRLALAISLASFDCAAAQAEVKISDDPTQNMKCSSGVCSPTAKKAILNVTELANMLAGGDVVVQSGSLAKDIEIDAALTWTSTHRLTLDSYHSIAFNQPLTVAGIGALTIKTNHGGANGDFRFFKRGSIKFWDAHSSLVINGNSYFSIESLRAFTKELRHTDGFGNYYAQMKNWGESGKRYSTPPILAFEGTFEGCGLLRLASQEVSRPSSSALLPVAAVVWWNTFASVDR